ncbi:MAG TPA: hypothetical protein PK842_01255 [Smithella sp.]|nr:hypothetical protein [Smithella sp.]OQC52459.1 MAG: VWA domain containing CoxE-like protein [Deltaproteobacteria bacterium ADurb.Bin022]HOG09371.1 hypothetical protein [Smithella sp.]HOO34658.1 hypothetical protein [Smithella sp.]HOS13123.1 hypothetical protein [Smithella sp.]
MFVNFFYTLKDRGIPVTPTSFLRLQNAMSKGLVHSLDDFYTVARTILVKSERYFDTYDQIFAHHFRNASLEDPTAVELNEVARAMLEEWLQNPQELADMLGIDKDKLKKMTPEELIQYFLERLKEQTEAHHGGNKWIGTGGTSPTGHSGYHPGGMRVGGESRNHSAIKVALDRRYRDYSQEGPLTQSQIGEALRRLRRLMPTGPKDVVNVDKTIYETMRNAGEIDIIFDRRLTDRLKVMLLIDNGGWSMEPYIGVVQTLFHYASSQFKDLKIFFFHNTIYSRVWADPQRYYKPQDVDELIRWDPETRVIIVGDASMAPYELMHPNGAIYVDAKPSGTSIERLRFIARTFPHSVWLNPMPPDEWYYSTTVKAIRQVFTMYELTLDGLEKAVQFLTSSGK